MRQKRWFSLPERNEDPAKPLQGVEDIARDYWNEFGRHYYTRYDYEGVETAQADALMNGLRAKIAAMDGKPSALRDGNAM